MTHLLNVPFVYRFTVIDGEGAFVTGATFTADVVFNPERTPFIWDVAELTAGMYEVRFNLDMVGTYFLRLVTTDVPGFDFSIYEINKTTDDIDIGDLISHYFTVRDDDGAYYDGAAISTSLAVGPVNEPFDPQIETFGNGLYCACWTAGGSGIYTLRLLADLSGIDDEPQLFEFEDEVALAGIAPSPIPPIMGATLDELVRAVALLCGDLLDTEVTDETTDLSTWKDDLTFAATSPKSIKGSNLYITRAADNNLEGREVRVLDSGADFALTLARPLPGLPRKGDRGYLVNLESRGFQRQRYVNCINDRVRDSYPLFLLPARWTFGVDDATMFRSDAPYLIPPREFTHIYSVDYPTPGYDPYETDIPLGTDSVAGWWWDDGEERIVIGGQYRHQANGQPVRIRGYGRHPLLVKPTDQCAVDPKWLVEASAGTLIISLRDARRLPEGQNHINRADGWLSIMSTNVMPGTIRIR